MEANDASSPGSLSSPPHSPEQGTPNSNVRLSAASAAVGVAGASTPTPAGTSPRTASRGLTASGQPRKKPGPKPKPKDTTLPDQEKKPRKSRKPVEPKDSNTAPAQRKRRTKASLEAQSAQNAVEQPAVQQSAALQSKQSESTPVLQSEPTPTSTPTLTPTPVPAPALATVPVPVPVPVAAAPQQSRVMSNQEPNFHNNPSLSHITVAPSPPRPSSSGQRYDPIRGGLFESKPQTPATVPAPISPRIKSASESPSIKSLIDPPSAINSYYSHPVKIQQQPSVTSAPVSPAGLSNRLNVIHPVSDVPPQLQQQAQTQSQLQQQSPPPHTSTIVPSEATPMEIDSEPTIQASVPMTKTNSTNSGTPSRSNAATPPPKAARPKDAPPALPAGSGLLSGTPFGPVANANGDSDTEGSNIWLTFALKGRDNVTINFAQEVEKKYGFAALHPRIAARRERQRQITAAGAALERAAGGTSNDEMSVDLSENESNVDMGGMDDDTSARENGNKKRRKRKQEDYDKEDDFIDDTELAWEQQALMAKDGFFVYSGPLVTEEKPAVERYV